MGARAVAAALAVLGAIALVTVLFAGSAGAANSGQLGSFGTPGTGAGQFRTPTLLGRDSADSSLFVLDSAEDASYVRIQKFSESGTLLGTAQIPTPKDANEVRPKFQGFAIDPTAGRLYLLQYAKKADSTNEQAAAEQILVYSTTPNGSAELVAPTGGPATLSVPSPTGTEPLDNPQSFTFDPNDGDLVVSAENRAGDYILQRIHTAGNGSIGARYTETTNSAHLNETTYQSTGSDPQSQKAEIAIGSDGTTYILLSTQHLFTLPESFVGAPTEVSSLNAAAVAGNWEKPYFVHPEKGGAGSGSQIVLSPDGSTLYWKEVQASAPSFTEPENFLVRGYSLADHLTTTAYGLGAAEGQCRIQSAFAALATADEGLFVLDGGSRSLAEGEEPTFGVKVFHFGPGGTQCPAPSPTLKLTVSGSEVTTVAPGTKVTLDGTASELGSIGATLEKAVWKIEGPGAPFEEEVSVTSTGGLKLEHVFSTAGQYTAHLAIKTQGGAAIFLDETMAAKPRKLTVTSAGGTTPTVTAVSPTHGPAAGGTTVTITGTELTGATGVSFGAVAATEVHVLSATEVTAKSPAGSGTVDVTVTTPGGTSTTSNADHYTYDAGSPTVTAVSPTHGPAAGGTTVTITGTELTGATAVKFGTPAATAVAVINSTQITAHSPAGTAGQTVDVTVTTPVGTSAPAAGDHFLYDSGSAPLPVTVQKAGTGQGTVTSAPAGINCGAVCSATFASGSTVTLTATAASGSTFAGWGGVCSGTGSCLVSVTAAKTVTATFTANVSVGPAPITLPGPAPSPKPKPKPKLKCKHGFAKKKVHGTTKCVKVKHKAAHKKGRGKHGRANQDRQVIGPVVLDGLLADLSRWHG